MKTHKLKTWPTYFQAVRSGKKTFEIRKNDRNYQVNDVLVLEEWKPVQERCDVHYYFEGDGRCSCSNGEYTGAIFEAKITYKLDGGQFGIEEGYCILGIRKTERDKQLKEMQERIKELECEIKRIKLNNDLVLG